MKYMISIALSVRSIIINIFVMLSLAIDAKRWKR